MIKSPIARWGGREVARWGGRKALTFALSLWLAGTVGAAATVPVAAQLTPPASGGAHELDRRLQQLGEPRRVLMIAAHPDDEDTSVLAYASHALGAETAYLSLNRGEGGQNAIGDGLDVELGLIRSRELQAARDIDGARQFFTRARDFGYSRSIEETERFWSEERILEDVVRVVRRFRPHVIVSIFSGSPADGHGHHQMAGVLAQRAYEVAGDPAVFPHLAVDEGLEPWTPLKLYRSTRFDPGATTLSLPVGRLDPRTGRTYFQIAMESRSQHLSQGFGTTQPTGPRTAGLALTDSRVAGPDTALFAGIPRGDAPYIHVADSLRAVVPAARPEAALPALLALAASGAPRDEGRRAEILSGAILASAGVVVDAIASAAEVVPGQSLDVEVTVYNGGPRTITIETLTLLAREGWTADEAVASDIAVEPDAVATHRFSVEVLPDARPTQPYFLELPPEGGVYDWSSAPPDLRGEPFDPPALRVAARLRIEDVPVVTIREAVHRSSEPTAGEIRRAIRVIPRLDVRLTPDRLVWSSISGGTRTFTVDLEHHGTDPLSGEVALEIEGWTPPPPQPFAFELPGESRTLTFEVSLPPGWEAGDATIRAVARTDDGHVFREAVEVIAYPHIRDAPRRVQAASEIRVAPVVLPDLAGIGYIRGVADRVPEALSALGLPLTILDEDTLARGDLSAFDVIVVGPRAYESASGPARHNDRLLEYTRNGGHLVVQYQQYGFVQGGYAPHPLTIARPHDRITDPDAPVRILEPDHPLFHEPHTIAQEDWEGWPQERGLYFAGTWDGRYQSLLEMEDPDLDPVRGGLLVAPYGDGTYVYTGLGFFRALPAAVPGPTRLFLNLLALAGEGESG